MTQLKLSSHTLFAIAALASLGFALATAAVARGMTAKLDTRARRGAHQSRGRGALANRLGGGIPRTGEWWTHLPPSFWTALRLQRQGRPAGAMTIAATATVAAILPTILARALHRRLPLFARYRASTRSYPNGHALRTSAMALTTGYVLYRESVSLRWTGAAPLGLASLGAGAGRWLLDRHFTGDIIGGYCAGLALGAAAAGVYELAADAGAPRQARRG
jgi:membrane-associated phospholipid phosphatase